MTWWTILSVLGVAAFTILVPFLLRRRGTQRTRRGHSPGGRASGLPCDRRFDGDAGYPPVPDVPRIRPLPGSRQIRQAAGVPARLREFGLPLLNTTDDVLRWLGLDLRPFLALANPADRIRPGRTNYTEWTVPKKRSGVRIICSPKPRLKAIQQRIKAEILDRAPPHEAAHGFLRGRNIVTNARPHVGRRLVVNYDLYDFFGYVRYPRVIGVFRRLGYSLEVSRCLALLCTHRPNLCPVFSPPAGPPVVLRPSRHAVQGSPTSPALANLALRRLDGRLAGLARRFDAAYTRYADDLTFSGEEAFKRGMARFLPLVRRIVRAEGFQLNIHKTRFMRSGQSQQVTGVVVNEKPNVRRHEYDCLKAILHNAKKAGALESQNRRRRPDFRAYLLGRAAHVRLLNPVRGQRLIDAIGALR